MTRTHPRQKFVLQSIALVTLTVVFILMWNVLRKTHLSDVQTSSIARASDPLQSLLNNLYLFLSVSFLAILFGITFAFYLEEWLRETNWIRRLVENQIGILNGVPSLLYGLLAVTISLPYRSIFRVDEVSPLPENVDTTSLKTTAFQGEASLIFATMLTFILLVMPRAIKTTQEAIRSVPVPIRESAYALGANRWHVLTKHIIPLACPRVLAGGCRAMSCAFATAALLVGIYIWGWMPGSGQIPGIFALFLGGSLLLSILSSFLVERYPADSI